MAVVQYIPAPPRPPRPLPPPKPGPSEAEEQYRQARAEKERLTVREKELRMAKAKRELIPRELVIKQSAFLVLSLRARLLSLAEQHADELLAISERRELAFRLDAIVRDALDEFANLPLRVSDPDWLSKLEDELEQPSNPPRGAKRAAK